MIIAERKKYENIEKMLKGRENILVVGCGGCVTVCLAGGQKEVEILAEMLRLGAKKRGIVREVTEATVERQCEREFVLMLADKVKDKDAIVSMACGVGVQFLCDIFPDLHVFPALDTKCAGAPFERGVWLEKCALCGDCVLDEFYGVCPIARCAKNLLNGPCGGSQNGKCEVDRTKECAWQLIYDRMKKFGHLDDLLKLREPKDWSYSRDGGPRKVIKEDAR
ncbi:MAG: methylenetetrahydrofolate reductase C-terminal domain-containing protein [Thermoplasmata archaeon]